MFVFLSKLLDLAFTPLAWSLLLGALSLALRRRFPKPALGLGVLGLVVLYLFSTFPVAGAITRHVEQGVLSSRAEGVVYDAVVVLGGMTEPGPSALAGSPQYGEAIERMLVGYAEVVSGGARHLIISGGLIEDDPGIPREAVTVAKTLRQLGLAEDQIILEDRSRNTRENALYTAEIVRQRGFKRILLVTSAFHMKRSLGCFRAVGLAPDVLPTDWRAPGPSASHTNWTPRAEALDDSTRMLRELAGRIVYRARGWTSDTTRWPQYEGP